MVIAFLDSLGKGSTCIFTFAQTLCRLVFLHIETFIEFVFTFSDHFAEFLFVIFKVFTKLLQICFAIMRKLRRVIFVVLVKDLLRLSLIQIFSFFRWHLILIHWVLLIVNQILTLILLDELWLQILILITINHNNSSSVVFFTLTIIESSHISSLLQISFLMMLIWMET